MQITNILVLNLLFFNFLIFSRGQNLSDEQEIPEDALLTVPEYIAKYKYPIEIHHVETEDGYILELHRIPYGINSNQASNQKPRPVVFVQHGLLASSACYIVSGTERGLGFVLAENGYDVWMGNARGSKYSRNHTSLSPKDKEFWNFSWHEIGVYDLPAMIDYTLNYTKQEKTLYIGHSQGTTSFFVMTSEKPEYNDKIKLMIALAPIAYMSHMENKYLKTICNLDGTGQIIMNIVGDFEYLPNMKQMAQYGNIACSSGAKTQVVCQNIVFQIFGYNEEQMDPDILPVIMGHIPAGASFKQLMHYGHEISSGKFQQFDYGPIPNYAKYNSLTPPDYDLSKVAAPVVLFYSSNDLLSAIVDVEQLYEELGNPVDKIQVADPMFNHMDYVFGKDVVTLVYNDVIRLFKKYQ